MSDFSHITRELLRRKYADLPDPAKDALSSDELTNTIHLISQNHRLHLDQEDALHTIVMAVATGAIRSGEFKDAVESLARISSNEAAEIARELNDKIFAPLRELYSRPTEADAPQDEHLVVPQDEFPSPEIGALKYNLPRRSPEAESVNRPQEKAEGAHYSLPHRFGNAPKNESPPVSQVHTPHLSATKPFVAEQLKNTTGVRATPVKKGDGQQISPPPTNSQPAQNSTPQEPSPKPKSYPVDPYREPVE